MVTARVEDGARVRRLKATVVSLVRVVLRLWRLCHTGRMSQRSFRIAVYRITEK